MFDFEKLDVYVKAKHFNSSVHRIILSKKNLNKTYADQLRRASFSILLNIAEGSGRFTKADKRNFYVISRGSVFECVAIIDFLKEQQDILNDDFEILYQKAEELSKMLFAMIRQLQS